MSPANNASAQWRNASAPGSSSSSSFKQCGGLSPTSSVQSTSRPRLSNSSPLPPLALNKEERLSSKKRGLSKNNTWGGPPAYFTEDLKRRYGFLPSAGKGGKGRTATPPQQPQKQPQSPSAACDAEVIEVCRSKAVSWLAGLGFAEVCLAGAQGTTFRTTSATNEEDKGDDTARGGRQQRGGREAEAAMVSQPSLSALLAGGHNRGVLGQVMQLAASGGRNSVKGRMSVHSVHSPVHLLRAGDHIETFDDIKDAARRTLQKRRQTAIVAKRGTSPRRSSTQQQQERTRRSSFVTNKRASTTGFTVAGEDDGLDPEPESLTARMDDAHRLVKSIKRTFRKGSTGVKRQTTRRLSGGIILERQGSKKVPLSQRLTMQQDVLIQNSKFLKAETGALQDRLRVAFDRFRDQQTQEVPRECIRDVVRHLGYSVLPGDVMDEILNVCAPYSTLDWGEFTTFMKTYARKEEENFREVFEAFDEDGSGDISKDELIHFLVSVGFTPLQEMIDEAMAIGDTDGNGALNYEEMCVVIRNYRQFEGFTRVEVANMELTFEQYCPGSGNGVLEPRLPVESLAEALVDVFGAAHKKTAHCLQENVVANCRKLQGPTGNGRKLQLAFDEFLVWARRLREEEIESYRPLFMNHDADGSGNIDKEELRCLLKEMGLTPLDNLLNNLIMICDKNQDKEINFEEYVHLMGLLRRTEGFSEEEVMDFEDVFERFDEDGSGEIDALEIVNVMRYLGFDASLQETHRLVAEVDANESGAVDFREFLHMMRVWRESEIQGLQTIYNQHVVPDKAMMPNDSIVIFEALGQIGHRVDYDDQILIMDLVGDDDNMKYCTLDHFIEIADKTRQHCTDKRAKYAGLKADQVQQYRRMFLEYVRDDNKCEISLDALSDALRLLGCPLRTREEQQQIARKIDEAKDCARRAGIRDRDLACACGHVTWWVFLQLVGWLTDEENYKQFSREMEVVEETDFNPGQVTRFRLVFEEWAKLEFMRATSRMSRNPRSVTKFGLGTEGATIPIQTVMVADRVSIAGNHLQLGLDGMVLGLQHGLGISLGAGQRAELARRMMEIDIQEGMHGAQPPLEASERRGSIDAAALDHVSIDFCGFLYLLRWMLNKNFALIKDVLEDRLGY